MIRRAFTVLAAIAVALLVAGCGGGPSEDAYERGLAQVQKHLKLAEEASLKANGADANGRSTALAEAQQRLAVAANTAEDLEPPDDVEQAHGRFVDALHDYADLFEELAALDEDDEGQTELYGKANEIVERLGDASRDIEKAGYEVERPKGDS